MTLEKYLELSQIAQNLEIENRQLSNALIELDEKYQQLENQLKDKDKTIADLIIDKARLKDLLLLNHEALNHSIDGHKIPAEKPSFLDRLLRGAQ